MRARLALPPLDQLEPGQRTIHDEILATRGNLDGPFLAWLRSPGLADPAQKLGAFCRYGTSMSLLESELIILLVAARYQCPAEQSIHEPIACKAGLKPGLIAQIRRGELPVLPTPRLQLLATLARELLHSDRIPQPTYDQAREVFGETALVEIVGIVGYYALVAYTLNAFEMMPP
jgi:4-carboxymuconolactone decarboxylase